MFVLIGLRFSVVLILILASMFGVLYECRPVGDDLKRNLTQTLSSDYEINLAELWRITDEYYNAYNAGNEFDQVDC